MACPPEGESFCKAAFGEKAELAALELPVFVKPARAGSSVGITRVTQAAGLVPAIEAARRHDPRVIVEQGHADTLFRAPATEYTRSLMTAAFELETAQAAPVG